MAETQETIADIIAEKRARADEIERDVAEKMKRGEMISDRYARELVADMRAEADRLEAALRREKAAIEADALAVGGIVGATAKKSLVVGDAAKLREALVNISKYADCSAMRQHDEHTQHYIEQIRKWAEAALAAPVRNCEKYKTPEDCMRAFVSYVRKHGKLGFIHPYTEVVKWLLAPATEQEGGSDGR